MDWSDSVECVDKEYCQEINHQLELVSKLNHPNLIDTFLSPKESKQNNLLKLEQSLAKLRENEIFLHNFKTNQVKISFYKSHNSFFLILFLNTR